MKDSKVEIGRWGEAEAEGYLSGKGYKIIARNVRTPYGEIDLIARQEVSLLSKESRDFDFEPVLVFIEVKTRRGKMFGPPEVAVNRRKQEHMLASAQAYLQSHPEIDLDWRVDVIAVQVRKGQEQPVFTHFENALSGFEPD
jgi:putative endonuclease